MACPPCYEGGNRYHIIRAAKEEMSVEGFHVSAQGLLAADLKECQQSSLAVVAVAMSVYVDPNSDPVCGTTHLGSQMSWYDITGSQERIARFP